VAIQDFPQSFEFSPHFSIRRWHSMVPPYLMQTPTPRGSG
jgi:hypothetical protein